jgi:hypothetical protein
LGTRDTFSRLRGSLDGSDTFVSGGHGVIKTAGATRHAERMRKVPVWALSDEEIKKLVKRMYPRPSQKAYAARMIVVVCKYYRIGETAGKIAEDMKMSLNAVDLLLRRINRAANNPAKPKGRPKGRPEVSSDGIQASM